jgi:hypothetical protein
VAIDFNRKRGERMISDAQLKEIGMTLGGYFVVIALPAELRGVANVEVAGNVSREVISFTILSLAMEIFNDQHWVARPAEPEKPKRKRREKK